MQCATLLLTSTVLGTLTVAWPVSTQHQVRAANASHVINCTDVRAIIDSSCWNTLDIPKYLDGWNKTTPTCAANDDAGLACCHAGEAWSTCFIRLSYDAVGADCANITPQGCGYPGLSLSPTLSPSIAPQVRYVLQNIYNVHAFVTSLYICKYLDKAGCKVYTLTHVKQSLP